MIVLLDANVLLDYLETREPYFEDSYQALLLCAEEKVSDGKLRETQTANYFSRYRPILCSAICECTILPKMRHAAVSVDFRLKRKSHGSRHETHGLYKVIRFSAVRQPRMADGPGLRRPSPHPPSASDG